MNCSHRLWICSGLALLVLLAAGRAACTEMCPARTAPKSGLAAMAIPVSVVRLSTPGVPIAADFPPIFTPASSPTLYAAGFDEFGDDDRDKVSVTKATLFSFVLPGAGQWYSGARGRAGLFLASEGIAWAFFGYFETVGAIKRGDYETRALADAGIDPTNKDNDFYRLISFYDSRAEYNEAGRIISTSRPYYPDEPYWNWQWSSEAKREEYRTLRNQSNESFNRGKFALGALLLNRLVSAVDALRTAKAVNRKARMELSGWKMHIKGKPLSSNPRVSLTFTRKF